MLDVEQQQILLHLRFPSIKEVLGNISISEPTAPSTGRHTELHFYCRNLIKPWVLIRVLLMDPNILGFLIW